MLIRSTIFNLLFYFWTLLVCVVMLPILFFPPKVVVVAGRIWARGVVFMLRFICGIKMKIEGQENLPEGACIIASKHQSAWETIIFYALCESPAYILKREVNFLPFFGWYSARVKTIAVNRGAGAKAMRDLIKQAKDRLQNGRQIIIFPEGTRIKAGEKGYYKPGVAAIYMQTGSVVVPVALNSGICWGRNSWVKKQGVISLKFLPVIEAGLPKKEFMARLESDIESESNKLLGKGAVS